MTTVNEPEESTHMESCEALDDKCKAIDDESVHVGTLRANEVDKQTHTESCKALEPKKRKPEKPNLGEGQKASPNVIIPNRMRPSGPEAQSIKAESQATEISGKETPLPSQDGPEKSEEGRLELLLEKAHLEKELIVQEERHGRQLSQLR